MATAPARNSAVVEGAFAAVPDDQVGEIVDGELVVSPRPAPRDSRAAVRIAQQLRGFDREGGGPDDPDGPGGWVLLMEPELHLGSAPDKLVPDLAGWRRERVRAEHFEQPAIALAPDWVCEVLSDRTEGLDRGRKRRIYRREGVRFLWLADPGVRTLEVYRLEGGRWVEVETFEGDASARAEPFERVAVSLRALWEL